ncbi:rhodanese family protein [Caulobacter sp. RHG1]|uniref:rhodanese family protein n=1 Tax=Caulobacter sp. (strain RHG1) TaxID=2545762 RepID=UPI001557BA26|nr:rhodanese family protein [Caulobacter sp. RHG1]NQE64352.1 Rhodanese-domain-containing inner membrane protein YgaP [Caulobacter sp. RHG1]
MTTILNPLKPDDVAKRLAEGRAVLIDIREPDEFARRRAKGALSRPLSTLDAKGLGLPDAREVIFTCRSGMRTGANGERLAAACGGSVHVLEGGLDAWDGAGLPVEVDRKAPLEMMRQVQIVAGSLVLIGVILGLTVSPWLLGVAGFVGAGLTFAGISGFCGMARLLALAPWNRPASA